MKAVQNPAVAAIWVTRNAGWASLPSRNEDKDAEAKVGEDWTPRQSAIAGGSHQPQVEAWSCRHGCYSLWGGDAGLVVRLRRMCRCKEAREPELDAGSESSERLRGRGSGSEMGDGRDARRGEETSGDAGLRWTRRVSSPVLSLRAYSRRPAASVGCSELLSSAVLLLQLEVAWKRARLGARSRQIPLLLVPEMIATLHLPGDTLRKGFSLRDSSHTPAHILDVNVLNTSERDCKFAQISDISTWVNSPLA